MKVQNSESPQDRARCHRENSSEQMNNKASESSLVPSVLVTREPKSYRIVWTIDLEAESPEKAARQALAIVRNSDSTAIVFAVVDRSQPVCVHLAKEGEVL